MSIFEGGVHRDAMIVFSNRMEEVRGMDAVAITKKLIEYETRIEELSWIGKCDVCAGDPSSVDDCACGGTGRMSDTIDYMRRIIFELQNKLDVANEMLIALGEEGDYWAGHCESCGVRKPIWSSSSRKGECDCGKEDGSDADDK